MLTDLDDKIKNYQGCYDALVTFQADALQTDDGEMSPRWNVFGFFQELANNKQESECTTCI